MPLNKNFLNMRSIKIKLKLFAQNYCQRQILILTDRYDIMKKVLIWRSKLYNWQRYIILIVQKWFGPSFVLMRKRENVWICHILAKKVISKEVRIIIAITYLTFWTRSTILSVATTCITITTGRLVCITISFLCWLICITIAIPGKLVSLVITIITGILISLTSGAITSLASFISVTIGSVASSSVSTLNQSCGRDFLRERFLSCCHGK